MSINKDKTPWSDVEKILLALGFKMGASLAVLSEVLGRSMTSINKALVRFGIRPLGSQPRGQKTGYKRRQSVTAKAYMTAIERYCLARGLSLGGINDAYFQSSPFFALLNKPVCRVKPKKRARKCPLLWYQARPAEQREEPQTWVRLEGAVDYLKSRGQDVRCLMPHMPSARGDLYQMGRHVLTPAQVLMEANRLRVTQGLDPLYVEDVTCH